LGLLISRYASSTIAPVTAVLVDETVEVRADHPAAAAPEPAGQVVDKRCVNEHIARASPRHVAP
jgi:hypothetical protein